MADRIFGWDLPPGVTLDMIDPPEAVLPRCKACGCWLRHEPDRHEEVQEHPYTCDGKPTGEPVAGYQYYGCYGSDGQIDGPHEPHTWHEYEGVRLYTTCRYCGTENEEIVW